MPTILTRRQSLSLVASLPLLCSIPHPVIITAKHSDGFCLFHSNLTLHRSPHDLVRASIEAAREKRQLIGLSYSLMDRHHPDGARCATSETARRRFVAYTHGQIRELLTNYGKIDLLRCEFPWPLDAEGWKFGTLHSMVYQLQPGIVISGIA